MNVQVADKTGRAALGLEPSDFTLVDNGKTRPIPTFHRIARGMADRPAGIVVILDGLNNSAKSIANDRAAVERYFKSAPTQLAFPMAVAAVSDAGAKMGSMSRSPETLLAELHELAGGLRPIHCADEVDQNQSFMRVWMPDANASAPGNQRHLSCLNERFVRSVNALRTLANRQLDLPGRAIFVWLGPGWPMLRNAEFRPDDKAERDNLFRNLVNVSNALEEAQVTLNLVSPTNLYRKTEDLANAGATYIPAIERADQITAANLSLAALAQQSGGQVLDGEMDIPSGIEACIEDAQAYYTLAFDTPAAADFGEYHSLAVTVDKPGLAVRAPTLYYAEQ